MNSTSLCSSHGLAPARKQSRRQTSDGAFLQAIIHTHARTIHAPPSWILDPNHFQVLQSIGVLVGQVVYANASSKESKIRPDHEKKKAGNQHPPPALVKSSQPRHTLSMLPCFDSSVPSPCVPHTSRDFLSFYRQREESPGLWPHARKTKNMIIPRLASLLAPLL